MVIEHGLFYGSIPSFEATKTRLCAESRFCFDWLIMALCGVGFVAPWPSRSNGLGSRQ